jgi:hypothetical protein
VKTALLRAISGDGLAQLTAPAYERLVGLAKQRGFPIVVLTYLDYESAIPNEILRRFAEAQLLPLVDLEEHYGIEELSAAGKSRHFSGDRNHPNESGYGLMARAVAPVVLDLLRRSGR